MTFANQVAERAVRAFASSSLAYLATAKVTTLVDLDLRAWLSFALFASLASILMSLTATKFGDDSPSFVSQW